MRKNGNWQQKNQELFYRIWEEIREKHCFEIKNKDERILKKWIEIIQRWGQSFKEMLGVQQEENTEINLRIELAPVKESNKSTVKNGKPLGIDNIRAEMLKYIGGRGIALLYEIIEVAWETQEVPND